MLMHSVLKELSELQRSFKIEKEVASMFGRSTMQNDPTGPLLDLNFSNQEALMMRQ